MDQAHLNPISHGQTYLDDNTKQHNTPLMLAYAYAMRMFGPAFGFGLGYVIMQIYIDPTLTPIIDKEVILCLFQFFFGFLSPALLWCRIRDGWVLGGLVGSCWDS